MLNYAVTVPIHSPIQGYFGSGIISLPLGIVAVVVSKRANRFLWAIVLMAVGYLGREVSADYSSSSWAY